jgi:hypothetical protein
MSNKPGVPRRDALKSYEGTNLLFFLGFILALGLLVAWVFQSYKSRNDKPARPQVEELGVVSEVVSTTSGTCLLYLGTKLSETNHTYRNPAEIPAADDGLVRGLFALPGVTEVIVDQRLIVLQKSPGAHWEEIQPGAKEIVRNHLHLHQ